MELTTLFVISGTGIFSMVSLRMLEIRYERCIGLAHVSVPLEKRIRPHAKKLSKAASMKREALTVRIQEIPERIKAAVAARWERARAAWESQYEFLAESFRGKKMLSGGSVSFFLLNISEASIPARKAEAPVADAAPAAAFEDLEEGEDDDEDEEDQEEEADRGFTGDPIDGEEEGRASAAEVVGSALTR